MSVHTSTKIPRPILLIARLGARIAFLTAALRKIVSVKADVPAAAWYHEPQRGEEKITDGRRVCREFRTCKLEHWMAGRPLA